ncbi:MAG TPA: nucleoside-diphosphate kinase [Dehalococcoidia bacterium]|jgi:nucleoside-diphosphate kinase|nr:nucleoside-diphosphate kinase [Dehalococcoidia bacterium]MAX18262.1 nucleoside-diphosphate kinase [Chloroflexota bacterium]MCD5398518.1 nucleoside-diphosphate kinase [Dehalococcoidia bacterium]HIA16874.1 nucleoside-diphosphate kinase [Dehalococcoidia bacterium]
MDRTLVLVKPDGVQRGLIGEIISRLERRGLKIVGMKLMQVSGELANRHYGEHEGKPFFAGLVGFITSGPIVAMAIEGNNVVGLVRTTVGATNPADSAPGTIRGDLGVDIGRNLIHGSDSDESAKRELSLFFTEGELLDYSRDTDPWIIEA